MRVWFIAERELRAILSAPAGWLVIAGFLAITGLFWCISVSGYVIASMDAVANPYATTLMSLTDHLIAPFFSNTSVILLMVCPAISMRLFSPEFKDRTMELLLTSPVSSAQIVLGKFIGAMGFVLIALLSTVHFPLSLWFWGDPDMGVFAGGYLALSALSASVIAMGMFFSACTASQFVALILTFSSALSLYVVFWVSTDTASWFQRLSFGTHLQDMMTGAIVLSDLTFFAVFIGFFLFATQQKLESERWR